MEPLTKTQIENIFKEIDQDHDGKITRENLTSTDYALSIFDNDPTALSAFDCFHDGKMTLQDFSMLCYGARFKLYELVIAKFNAEKYLNKYLLVSAPGQAAPSIKQSYMKLKAHCNQPNQVLHSFGVEFGVDKPHQQEKIKQIEKALGHTPHEVFLMLKIKTNQKGEELAAKLHTTSNNILELVKGLAPQMADLINGFKVYSKYADGYTYLILEVDNPLIDGLISFATQVIESISPLCALKLKFKFASNLSNLLKEDFDYTKSGGQALLEFDIDHVTMKKLKEMLADNVDEIEGFTPLHQIYTLLFEELKVEAEFNNLGEALTSALQVDPTQLPKLSESVGAIKEMNIKETVDQFEEGGSGTITLLNQNCQAEGEFSINLHDFFLKLTFDLHIHNAFDILG